MHTPPLLSWVAGGHSPLSPGRPTQRSCDSLTSVWLLWLTKQNLHLGSQAFLQEGASHSYLLHQDRLSGSPEKKPVLCNGDLQEVSSSQALPRKGCCISRPHGATCAPGETGGKPGASFSGPSTRTITARPATLLLAAGVLHTHRYSRTAGFHLCPRNDTVSASKFLYSLKLLFLLERH